MPPPRPGALAPILPGERRRLLRAFRPPLAALRFWIVQVGVLSIALFHDVVLVGGEYHPFDVGDAVSSALLLVPVIYAAVNFGVVGAVATALWATALIAPHWWFMHPLTTDHVTIELANLAILNAVAVVVGQRADDAGCRSWSDWGHAQILRLQ